MLERLADLLRGQDTRGGFEATPDMLSITGMTLEQFADLMAGLGYKAERGEREKVKPPAEPVPPAEGAENPIPEESSPVAEAAADAEAAAPETEVFYTFAWAPRPRAPRPDRAPRREGAEGRNAGGKSGARREGGKPEGKRGGKGKHGKGGKPDEQPRNFQARPPKKDRPIDPDSPFAVLAALKGKT
jgi:ATP-dependent RNA helicase SUPV3L1/SUV3